LIFEISADESAIRNASTGDHGSDLLTRIAVARGARPRPDLILRPAHNEYSRNCHVPDSRVTSGKR
jgi:hypothetical protein